MQSPGKPDVVANDLRGAIFYDHGDLSLFKPVLLVRYDIARCLDVFTGLFSRTFDSSTLRNWASVTSRFFSKGRAMTNNSTLTHTSPASPDFKNKSFQRNLHLKGIHAEFKNKKDSKSRFCN